MRRGAWSRARAPLVVLLVAVPAWLLLLSEPALVAGHAPAPPAHHGGDPHQRTLALDLLPSLTAGWVVMVVAMMAPLLVSPVRHVLDVSLRRRRARSVTLFLLGHGIAWTAAGGTLLAAMLAARHVADAVVIVAAVGVATLAWQASPARQRCLNRGRAHPALAAFGFAADRDALRFGVTHGAWCVGSCWALMLLPLALPQGHLVAMALVTFVIVAESFEPPQPPRWRLRVPTRLVRIVVAQTRMRLQARPARASRDGSGRTDP